MAISMESARAATVAKKKMPISTGSDCFQIPKFIGWVPRIGVNHEPSNAPVSNTIAKLRHKRRSARTCRKNPKEAERGRKEFMLLFFTPLPPCPFGGPLDGRRAHDERLAQHGSQYP